MGEIRRNRITNWTWEHLLKEISEGKKVHITRNGEPVAVMLSPEHYDQLKEDLARLQDLER